TAAGDSSAGYAVVFSYVLDGLVWEELWPDTALVSTDITLEKPYWNGAFWAVSPKRTRAPGTNSYRIDDSATVTLTWTDGTLKLLGPLQRKPNLAALVHAIRQRDTALVPAELRPYGLLHANGNPAVAVIEERSGNTVSVAGRAMARMVAQQMNEWLAHAEVQRRLGTDNRGLALLIAYHEYMWELLGALTDQHVLQEPAAFGSAAPTPEGVRPLILLVTK
ncbi:MAG TPA: hypothetical protein VGP61_12630, partial [Gemmatimonadales bacterium]|nr:hypothetical protein [Gemmatimonadales bacterium]